MSSVLLRYFSIIVLAKVANVGILGSFSSSKLCVTFSFEIYNELNGKVNHLQETYKKLISNYMACV